MSDREYLRRSDGSLTVEASLAVPPVFLCLWMFLQLFLFLHVQTEMQTAMTSVVRRLSEYGTVYSQISSMSAEEADDLIHKIGIDSAIGRVAGQAYLGYLLREEIEDDDWIVMVSGGTSGVSASGSRLFEEKGKISLLVSYRFTPFSSVISFGSLPVVQRVDAGSFFGKDREVKKTSEEDEEEPEMVYVASRGTVYHCVATCTHLKIDVRQVAYSDVGKERNNDGEIYRQCTYCDHTPIGSTVYITDYGNRFHTTITCSELRRTYESITKEEAESRGLRGCKKCSASASDQ